MGLKLKQLELSRYNSPVGVMDIVESEVSIRKLRLIICACAYHALKDNYWEPVYDILDTIHKYADGLIDIKVLKNISIANSGIGQLRHWLNIGRWSDDHLKAGHVKSEFLSYTSSPPCQINVLADIMDDSDCNIKHIDVPQNVKDLALVTYNSHYVVPGKVCIRDVATYRETIDGCCNKYADNIQCDCMLEACPDNLLDPHGMLLMADMLEEYGIEDRTLLGHLREHTRKVVCRYVPGLHCIKCGKRGLRRHGIHFDHEFRCGECDYSWEPGRQITEVIELPAYHYKGCWALDRILGRE